MTIRFLPAAAGDTLSLLRLNATSAHLVIAGLDAVAPPADVAAVPLPRGVPQPTVTPIRGERGWSLVSVQAAYHTMEIVLRRDLGDDTVAAAVVRHHAAAPGLAVTIAPDEITPLGDGLTVVKLGKPRLSVLVGEIGDARFVLNVATSPRSRVRAARTQWKLYRPVLARIHSESSGRTT